MRKLVKLGTRTSRRNWSEETQKIFVDVAVTKRLVAILFKYKGLQSHREEERIEKLETLFTRLV